MSQNKVVVVDYGLGNLYSVQRALETCGAENIEVSSFPESVQRADFLVLPGVGAFSDGMLGLHERNLIKPIMNFAASGKPMLGICLGMQLMASYSEEFGRHEGLGLVPGKVIEIPKKKIDGSHRKTPFIGWSQMQCTDRAKENSILSGLDKENAIYLVHSYHVVPDDDQHLLATYDFDETTVTAAINCGNITGLQFHPEKSATPGLNILQAFLKSGNT